MALPEPLQFDPSSPSCLLSSLLDEVTSALDVASEKLVQGALQTAMEGRTTIVISYCLNTIVNAEEFHIFDHWCIIETRTHRGLMGKQGKYWTMAMLQQL